MKLRRETRTTLVELVETHNIALAIRRLRAAGPYDDARWKRALLHAIYMETHEWEMKKKLREALNLP